MGVEGSEQAGKRSPDGKWLARTPPRTPTTQHAQPVQGSDTDGRGQDDTRAAKPPQAPTSQTPPTQGSQQGQGAAKPGK